MGDLLDSVKTLVEGNGDKVRNGKAECFEWKKTHENCKGCQFELGCLKHVSIGLALMASDEYNSDKIQETVDEMMDAKTVKAVKTIHIPEVRY